MAYTKQVQFYIDYLRASVRLQDPNIESDPAFVFTDEDLYNILKVVTPTHNESLSIDTLPEKDYNFVLLLSKKEIYYRLATTSAPFYPLSAEGASLQKNVRFDHYIALVKQVTDDYQNLMSTNSGGVAGLGNLQTFESVKLGSKYYQNQGYNQSTTPTIALSVDNIQRDFVEISWTKYKGSIFNKYRVLIDTKPIVDEYGDSEIRKDLADKYFTHDIHKTKYRISELEPYTDYYVCVVVEDRYGLTGYSEVQFKTLQ